MKESKNILKGQLLLSLATQAIFVTLIALPQLDPYKQQLVEATQIPSDYYWIPLLLLLLVVHLLIFGRLKTHLVEPLSELYDQTKLASRTIAFKKKSMNAEEDHLKHFIESQTLRTADLEQEVARMETNVERINDLAKFPPEEIENLQANLKAATLENEDSAARLTEQQDQIAKQEKEMVSLRRQLRQAGRDLENLQGEISVVAENTDSTPLSSILVERLKTPLSLINNLSWRLAKTWAETPPAQIREGLEEINKHSEEQLELLRRYESESGGQQDRDAL